MPGGPDLTTNDRLASDTVEAVARRSYGKLVALLASRGGDIALAEDALSEAFAIALTDWKDARCPSNPEAWLLTVARRKMIDAKRKEKFCEPLDEDIREFAADLKPVLLEEEIPDRRLALIFACSHPAIERTIRTPLILQVLLRVHVDRIASAFLASPAAMTKRLVRAKSKIREARIPLQVPEPEQLSTRLETVLEAIYAAFTTGWNGISEFGSISLDLAEEALYLGRLVVMLLPNEPEPLGLLSLMLFVHARREARRDARGEYVPLEEQDSSRWILPQLTEAERLLKQASQFDRMGRYQLEAAIQSAHVFRLRTRTANWKDILLLYDALYSITQSPVVGLNRTLAIAMVHGAEAGLCMMPDLAAFPSLSDYQPYWATRAELLSRCEENEDAILSYQRAEGLSSDAAIRRFLRNRSEVLKHRERRP